MSDRLLDEIIDLLDRHHQRATYGAVGAVVDRPATFLMGGRPRNKHHSWLVNATTGLPTGYDAAEMHPSLRARERILSTSEELEQWLAQVRTEPMSH